MKRTRRDTYKRSLKYQIKPTNLLLLVHLVVKQEEMKLTFYFPSYIDLMAHKKEDLCSTEINFSIAFNTY